MTVQVLPMVRSGGRQCGAEQRLLPVHATTTAQNAIRRGWPVRFSRLSRQGESYRCLTEDAANRSGKTGGDVTRSAASAVPTQLEQCIRIWSFRIRRAKREDIDARIRADAGHRNSHPRRQNDWEACWLRAGRPAARQKVSRGLSDQEGPSGGPPKKRGKKGGPMQKRGRHLRIRAAPAAGFAVLMPDPDGAAMQGEVGRINGSHDVARMGTHCLVYSVAGMCAAAGAMTGPTSDLRRARPTAPERTRAGGAVHGTGDVSSAERTR